MRIALICFALTISLLAIAAEQTNVVSANTNALSLSWVIGEVLSNNPALKSARANWRAARERIPQAKAWEDAMTGVDVERMNKRNPVQYSDAEFMISQEFPLTGKNRLRGKIAESDAGVALLDVTRRQLDLIARARSAFFKLVNANAQYELNKKNQSLWKQFAEISRRKYEVGTASQADVLMAETEVARIDETLISNQRDISDAESQLNVLMNRPPKTPLGRPEVLLPQHFLLTLEQLQQIALDHRPELLTAQTKIEGAKRRIDLARRQWIPDPEFRIEARQVEGTGRLINEYDTGVFFKFPLFNQEKLRAGQREARAMLEMAEHDLSSVTAETRGMVNDALKKVETFHHHYELFRDRLLPLAQQTVTSKRTSYETDKASLLDLLTAQRTVQDVESMYWNHVTDYQMALAELEALVGVQFNDIFQPLPPKKEQP